MEHSGEQFLAYADLDVRVNGKTLRASPSVIAGPKGSQAVPTEVPGLGRLMLSRMDADHGRIALLPPSAESSVRTAILDFSVKPLVNLVWVGALLTLLGTALAGVRRHQEQTTRSRVPARVKARQVEAAVAAGKQPAS
jgi:hypothetical protein